jgi:hypothetical protein
MAGLLSRLLGRRKDAAVDRAREEAQMSPAERRFVNENVEGHQADELVEEHLGGIDPNRLLGDSGEQHES